MPSPTTPHTVALKPDPAILAEDHTDFELMLRAWHSGPSGREVALQMADQNRQRLLNNGDAK